MAVWPQGGHGSVACVAVARGAVGCRFSSAFDEHAGRSAGRPDLKRDLRGRAGWLVVPVGRSKAARCDKRRAD